MKRSETVRQFALNIVAVSGNLPKFKMRTGNCACICIYSMDSISSKPQHQKTKVPKNVFCVFCDSILNFSVRKVSTCGCNHSQPAYGCHLHGCLPETRGGKPSSQTGCAFAMTPRSLELCWEMAIIYMCEN